MEFPMIEMIIMIAKHTTIKYRIMSSVVDFGVPGQDMFDVVTWEM
jgi:hypothetical protein